MKASLFSFVAAAALFLSTAASAAAPFDHDHDRDLRRLSPRERARWEAQHRAAHGPNYGYRR